MPFSDFKPTKRTVTFPGGSAELRALSLPDLALLISSHEDSINDIVQNIRARKDVIESGDFGDEAAIGLMTDLFIEVIRESPILAANIIAICADEPEGVKSVLNLPVNIQVEALVAVGEMTFTDLASVKKFIANVKMLIAGLLPKSATVALAAE